LRALYAVIIALVAGCGTAGTAQGPESTLEDLRDAQETWLRGLQRGQSIHDIPLPAAPNSQYSLEIFADGGIYQYVKGMYPGTRMLYGLYFESGRLTGLLIDQDVTDFFQCEHAYRHSSGTWLERGIRPVTEWIRQRDLLDDDFDPRVAHADPAERDETGAVEAIAHAPLAAIAAPIYGAYWLSGGAARDRERARQRAESVRSLRPGMATEKDVEGMLGLPEDRRPWETGSLWSYDRYTIVLATAGGVVTWKETGRIETPRNPATTVGHAQCGDMRAGP
jgi:hypothetical protein